MNLAGIRMASGAVCVALSIAASPVLAGSTIFVDDSAQSGGNGRTWGMAYQYLQDALTAARNSSGAITSIWVAAGTYQPDRDAAHPTGTADRYATFGLIAGVAIRGGFAGNEDPATFDLTTRDFTANQSTLSGDLSGNDESDFTNNGENSYHVTTGSNTIASAILDGVTIAGGNANLPYSSFADGGGMYVSNGSPTLTHCTFRGNAAPAVDGDGGGMYSTLGSPVLIDCVFSGNTTMRLGGGMHLDRGSPALTGCTFNGNSATEVFYYGSVPVGGGRGGGLCSSYGSTLTVSNCAFIGNTSTGSGGGMVTITGSTRVVNCVFRENICSLASGGGFCARDSSPMLTNCIFTKNWAYDGAGLANVAGHSILTHCTISENSGSNGSGVHSDTGSQATLRNCIVWGNHGDSQIRRAAIITYSCIQGGWAGAGNIVTDPRLVSAVAGDVRLGAGSPCIDAGENAAVPADALTDLAGATRFFDDPAVPDCQWLPDTCGTAPIVDMGAYESIAPPPTITQQPLEQTVCEGTTVTFTITAYGTGALTYQWQREGIDLPEAGHYSGTTTNQLAVTPASPADSAHYSCVVTDANGNTISGSATLLVRAATLITQQPVAAASMPATFTVVATGEGALTYQWQRNGVDLADNTHYAGTTTPSLSIAYCACADPASYRCVVTGGCGSVVSDAVALSCQPGDFDFDTDVDQADFGTLQACLNMDLTAAPSCGRADLNGDGLVKSEDALLFVRCLTGADVAANQNCGQ